MSSPIVPLCLELQELEIRQTLEKLLKSLKGPFSEEIRKILSEQFLNRILNRKEKLEKSDELSKPLNENDLAKLFTLIIKNDQPDLFLLFAELAFPNKMPHEYLGKLFNEAIALRSIAIVDRLVQRVPNEMAEQAFIRFMHNYCCDASNNSCPIITNVNKDLVDQNLTKIQQQKLEDEVQRLAKILLPYCLKKEIVERGITYAIVVKDDLALLKLILSFRRLNKYLDRDNLLLQKWIIFSMEKEDRPIIREYLISNFLSKQDIEECVGGWYVAAAKKRRIELLRKWKPLINTETAQTILRDAFNGILGMYLPSPHQPYHEHAASLSTCKKTKEEIQALFTLLFDTIEKPNFYQISLGLNIAIIIKDLTLFQYITSCNQIKEEDRSHLIFANNVCVSKENSEFIRTLLNHFLDPHGKWSLFVPLVEGLSQSAENLSFLNEYFEVEYVNRAPLLAAIPKMLDEDNALGLKKLIEGGLLVKDPCLFVKDSKKASENYKLTSLFRLAKNKRSYQCLEFLFQSEIPLYDNNGVFERHLITKEDIIDLNRDSVKGPKIIVLLIKNYWHMNLCFEYCKDSYHSKNDIDPEKVAADFKNSSKERVESIANEPRKKDPMQKSGKEHNLILELGQFADDVEAFVRPILKWDLISHFLKQPCCFFGTEMPRYLALPRLRKQIALESIIDSIIRTLPKPMSLIIGIPSSLSVALQRQALSKGGLEVLFKITIALAQMVDLKTLRFDRMLNLKAILRLESELFPPIKPLPHELLYKSSYKKFVVVNIVFTKEISWLDAIRFLDFELMKSLINQYDYEKGLNLRLDRDPIRFIVNRMRGQLNHSVFNYDRLTPFTLFLASYYSGENYNDETLKMIAQIFKWMINANLDPKIRSEVLGPLRDPNTGGSYLLSHEHCKDERLKEILKGIAAKYLASEKNWAALSITQRFLNANLGNQLQDSILMTKSKESMQQMILAFSGFPASAPLCTLVGYGPCGPKGLLNVPCIKSRQRTGILERIGHLDSACEEYDPSLNSKNTMKK